MKKKGDILILTDLDGGTAVLTCDSPQSHYGIPVLRIEAKDIDGDFGPADLIDATSVGGAIFPAANIVVAWARQSERTPQEVGTARQFLSQWPDGPQV